MVSVLALILVIVALVLFVLVVVVKVAVFGGLVLLVRRIYKWLRKK